MQQFPSIYVDFALQFLPDPFTGDVVLVEDVDSVAQGVRNIVLTNFSERFHHPLLATNTIALLFENFDSITAYTLQNQIATALANYEPRANVLSVNVVQDVDNDALSVSITFSIVNNLFPVTVTIPIQRIR